MARHPAKRAHILALLGAVLLIATFGTLAIQLGNEMARHGHLDSESASSELYIRAMHRDVSNTRICHFAWLAEHDSAQLNCFATSLHDLAGAWKGFPAFASTQAQLDGNRHAAIEKIRESLQQVVAWNHNPSETIQQPGIETVLSDLDASLTQISRADNDERAGRLADMLRNTSWQKRLDMVGIMVGVMIMICAGWVLDRSSLAAAKAEAGSRDLALQLQAVLDSLTLGVGVFGTDGRLWHWNDRFAAVLGLDEGMLRSGLAYETLSTFLTVGGAPLLEPLSDVERSMSGGIQAAPVTVECRGVNGADLELTRTLFVPVDGGRERRGFVLTAADITLRLRSERALGEAQKLRAVGQLTAGIAHDFKNLLTVIMGNLELVSECQGDAQPTRRQEYLAAAEHAARRSEALTGQLLSFIRRQKPAPDTVVPAEMFRMIGGLLARVIGTRITVQCDDAAGVWSLRAHAAQLESALLNLAINARDAMPQGGTLHIHAANVSLDAEMDLADEPVESGRAFGVVSDPIPLSPGAWVRIDITDTGSGMDRDVLDRLFEPFFTTKEEGAGTGLGMAMVVSFAHQSSGRVAVATAPGKGTRITLWLPGEQSTPILPPTLQAPAVSSAPCRALVVEDDPAIRDIVVTILGLSGYRILEAGDGEQAFDIAAASGEPIDLLVTDVQLPGPLDGFTLSRVLAERHPDMGVVYMSGEFTSDTVRPVGALESGQILPKPFRRDGLMRVVVAAMSQRADA